MIAKAHTYDNESDMYNQPSLAYHTIKMSIHAFECNPRPLNSENRLICLILYLKRVAASLIASILLLNLAVPPISRLFYSLRGRWKVRYDMSVSVCVGISHITSAIPAQNTSVVAWQCDWLR